MQYEYNKENFDKIMEEFVKLTNAKKRDKIIEEISFLITFKSKLCILNNSKFTAMYNKEMSDLKSRKVSEKDFLEAVYAYLYLLKSAEYQFVNTLADSLSEAK